jgi:hypothetical protein
MSKVILSSASFVAGMLFVFAFLMFSGNHTSTTVHAQSNLGIGGAVPIVPPLTAKMFNDSIVGGSQSLDGIDCIGCVVDVDVIRYGGGAFSCVNCAIRTKRLSLEGAAENTFRALMLFSVIPQPKAAPNKPKSPTLEATEIQINPQDKIDLVSLSGLKK